MNRFIALLTLVLVLALSIFAQDKKEEGMKMEGKKMEGKMMEGKKWGDKKMDGKMKGKPMHGYVVDAMCAGGMMKKDNPMEKAAAHTKSCALEENCAASGYGLFSDGKYMKFDADGDKMAMDLIKNTKMEKEIMVDVWGTMGDKTMAVSSIKEAKMGKGMRMGKPDKMDKEKMEKMDKEMKHN